MQSKRDLGQSLSPPRQSWDLTTVMCFLLGKLVPACFLSEDGSEHLR